MKKTIHSRLAGYSILLILLTTISVLAGAVFLQLYQTNRDNQIRLQRATEIFHQDFRSHLNTLDLDWKRYTSNAVRTNQFMLPLAFAPYITYIPKHLQNLAAQYDTDEIALYLPDDEVKADRLYAVYSSEQSGVVLLQGSEAGGEKLLFQWDSTGNLRQKSVELVPRFSEIYHKESSDFTLESWQGRSILVSHLHYVNTTFEDLSMGITSGSHIGYVVLRTNLHAFINAMEHRLDVSFFLFDPQKKGGSDSFNIESLSIENYGINKVFGFTDEKGESFDVYISPVLQGDETIGYLAATISQVEFYNRLKTTVLVLLMIALLVVLISFLFSWRYVSRISSPLKLLADSFETYTKGGKLSSQPTTRSLEQIKSNSYFYQISEFKNLINSFKHMMGFIDEQTQTIEHQNTSLEDQIEIIEQKNRELEEINKLKDDFLASTSHELRTPLHGIIGIAEVMLAAEGVARSDDEKKHLSMIISNGRRLSNLLSDLLDFYRMKNYTIQLNRIPIKLHSIVDAVLTFSKPLIGNKPIELINDVAEDLPPVDADKNKLEQVFFNLLSNAAKFTENGIIRVGAERYKENVLIRIEDTGVGIPADELDTIFEVFTQLDGSITREQPGTGLGLSITKKLIEQHGSELKVESELGKGTAFCFSLPVCESKLESIENPYASVEQLTLFGERLVNTHPIFSADEARVEHRSHDGKEHRILIVDDDPVNLEILRVALESFGYGVSLADNGSDALEMLECESPDLVLLDLMMPRMSGFELCQLIRQKWDIISLPIIILTAKNQLKDLERGFQLGANDYLTKPFHPREITARVQTQLMARDAIRHLQENERLLEEIARRKKLENELVKSKKQLLNILNVEEDAIVCLNESDHVLFFNQGAEKIFGVSAGDILYSSTASARSLMEFPSDPKLETEGKNKVMLVDIRQKDGSSTRMISYISRFEVDDEVLTTVILPRQEFSSGALNQSPERLSGLEREIPDQLELAEQLNKIGYHLTSHQQKIQTLEKALGEVVSAISSTGVKAPDAHLLIAGGALAEPDPGDLNNDSVRKLVLKIMITCLEAWEISTGKSKIDLAQESGIWSVQLDGGSYKARTLSKYLRLKSIPKKPRVKSVINTARFVIDTCELEPDHLQTLETSIDLLKELITEN
jgi:two-component system, sensor histidine kinase ChiS